MCTCSRLWLEMLNRSLGVHAHTKAEGKTVYCPEVPSMGGLRIHLRLSTLTVEVAAPEYKWYKFETLTRDAQQVLGVRARTKAEGKTVMPSYLWCPYYSLAAQVDPPLLTWQPQGTCSSSPDNMCVLCVCLLVHFYLVGCCILYAPCWASGLIDWLIDWLKNWRHKGSHSSSGSGSNHLVWLQIWIKAMGWCIAECKMLRFCAKTIMKGHGKLN